MHPEITNACWASGEKILFRLQLESKQELFGRESCEWRNLLYVELWGGSANNELESWLKNSSAEKAANGKILLHVGL